jgi:hypothetical protein
MKIRKDNVFVVAIFLALSTACLATLLVLAILTLKNGTYATHINVKNSVLVLSASPRGILAQSGSLRNAAIPARFNKRKLSKLKRQISSSKLVVISPPMELEK